MTAQLGGQPIYVLPEGSQRILGRDAQRTNIAVAYAVASAVRTSLGPKGMDKMLVDDIGDIVITNDGATILQEMAIEHPAAKMLVEAAKTQDDQAGDGTTTVAVLAGEFLKKAGDLLDQDIHASTIINGYKLATHRSIEILKEIGDPATIKDVDILDKIAAISIGSKLVGLGTGKDFLAKLIVRAITQVAEQRDGKYVVDEDLIKIEKRQGGTTEETELIEGVIVDKEIVHTGMPKKIDNAKILLLDSALEIKDTEIDAKIEITSPDKMQEFLDQEEKMLKDMTERVAATGANILFCQKGIDDTAQHFLAKKGIMAIRRVKKSDMDKLAKATGGRVVTSLHDASKEDLGNAGLVEEQKVGTEAMVFVRKCKNPKSVTLLIRGGTEHLIDETERALVDAMGAVSCVLEEGKYVIGGGAIEIELAVRLRKYAEQIGGREQLAIQAFADALEVIPKTLASSAGMDPIDTLVQMRSKHATPDGKYQGVDVFDAKVEDVKKRNIIEPMKVKKEAISSASGVAEMILRIDDMISGRSRPSGPPGGGMPGMPGMGGHDFE